MHIVSMHILLKRINVEPDKLLAVGKALGGRLRTTTLDPIAE